MRESIRPATAAVTSAGELYGVATTLPPASHSITRARNDWSSEPTHARITITRLWP